MILKLADGREAIIDEEDLDLVAGYSWRVLSPRPGIEYAVAKGRSVLMHRLIAQTPRGKVTDHRNHNGLDNRRSNLRVCTYAENNRNTGSSVGTSKYKGVCRQVLSSGRIRWRAYIRAGGGSTHIGSFSNEIDAAFAYNDAAIRLHGEFAHLNIVELAA